MAEDETGWSEKGKGAGRGERSSRKDEASGSGAAPPTRPSKREGKSARSERESTVVRTPSDAGARKVAKAAATAGQRDVWFSSRLGFPALVALVCMLGVSVVFYAWTTREALATPVQNLDHWHAVYGVYNCNATGEGDAKFLPPFQSTQDDTGIHSHGDGLLHIHPFFELSSGDNAQMRHFLSEMNIEITPEAIIVQNQYDAPVQLAAGQECADGSGPAEIKVLHWDFDFEALAEDRPEPEIITEDFGNIKFEHDREVFVFAYVGADTPIEDIPVPPQERFDTLNNVSSAIDYQPTQLNPQDTGTGVDADDDADAESDTDTEEDGG